MTEELLTRTSYNEGFIQDFSIVTYVACMLHKQGGSARNSFISLMVHFPATEDCCIIYSRKDHKGKISLSSKATNLINTFAFELSWCHVTDTYRKSGSEFSESFQFLFLRGSNN